MDPHEDIYRVFDGDEIILKTKGSLPNVIQSDKRILNLVPGDIYVHEGERRLIHQVDSVSSKGNKTSGFNAHLAKKEE